MEIARYLPINRITVLPQRFLSYIKKQREKAHPTPQKKTPKNKTKKTNSTSGIPLVLPDSQAFGPVPVSTSPPQLPLL